ncbi:MAG: NAD-dependent epimerase/dehydratase family protein [Promethearchaeota archaeon]
MNILVTGANGFIGSILTKKLIEAGHKVKAMVLKGTSEVLLKDVNCNIVYADVTKEEMLIEPLNNIDIIYHLAALTSIAWTNRIVKVNYGGTKTLLEKAIQSGVKRFVYMSSLVVHGFKNYHEADESTPIIKPKWYKRPYIKSKILSERLLQEHKNKIEIVIIRPGFMPYGPHDILAGKNLIGRLDSGQTIPHINHGKAKTCYSYVENLCDGLILAGISPKAVGQTYLITDKNPPYITMKLYMDKICEELGIKKIKTTIPYTVAFPFVGLIDIIYRIFMRKKLPFISIYMIKVAKYNLYFRSDKAKKELGYEPKILIDEGIKRTIEWYKDFFKNHIG